MVNEERQDGRMRRAGWGASLAQVTLSDKVILGVILMGFLGAPVLLLGFGAPPILVSVLVGSAVAALVYRFLGGISEETTLVVGGLKLGGALAALVGVALLVNGSLVRQSSTRMVVEGTFRDLVKQGVAERDGDEDPGKLLVHSLQPVDRQMRLYAQEEYDDSDLSRYNLEWALVARPATDVLKWEFRQRYRLPVSSELVDPMVRLQPEQETIRKILLVPLALLDGQFDRVLTIRYVENDHDPYREVGKFVADVTSPPTELRWEDDGATIAEAALSSAPVRAGLPSPGFALLSQPAWAQSSRPSSVFDALEDPDNRRAIQEFLGSPDLKKQLLARDRLLARGTEALSFVEWSLKEPSKGADDRAILLHNLAEIVEGLAQRGVDVPDPLYSSLAMELYVQGGYEDAGRLFERVSGSDDALLQLRRGNAYYQTQRYGDAVSAFERSVALGGTEVTVLIAAQRNLGAAYEKTGSSEKALEAYRSVLALDPGDAQARARVAALSGGATGGTVSGGAGPAEGRDGRGYWVLVGLWRSPGGFETVHFNVSEPPAPGDRIKALDTVYRRNDAPSAENGWHQGTPIGVVAPGERLTVLEVRRSGPDDQNVWARVVRADG